MAACRINTRPLVLLVLLMVAMSSVGCQRSRAAGIALMRLVGQAQADVNRLCLANDSLMADLSAANGEVSRLIQENSALRAGMSSSKPTTNTGNTGFENIKDVEAERVGNTVTVRVASDILFSSGKIDLKSTAQTTLNDVAGVLNSKYGGKTIRVEGYTDTDPIRKSSWKDNLDLSLQRAAAVHRYLQTRGVSADRMYAAGFGESQPLGSKSASRRVEIVVVLSE